MDSPPFWGPLNMFGSSCCLSASVQESQIQAGKTDIIWRTMEKIPPIFLGGIYLSKLAGGFKSCFHSPLFGEDSHVD